MKKYRQTMAKKVMNEAQLREYVENEVRRALLAENLEENMTDEGILKILSQLTGIGNGQGVSMEGIIGAILGHIAIAPILTKLLNAIGIPADQALGQFILKRVSEVGGYSVGQWIDRKWDPIGIDNKLSGKSLIGTGEDKK